MPLALAAFDRPRSRAFTPSTRHGVAPRPRFASVFGESDLADRLRERDPDVCEALVREFAPRMLSVARRMLRNEEDAADAVQDAFVSALESLDGFAGRSGLRTWLHRIVVNVCLMRLRTRRRRPTVSLSLAGPSFDDAGRHAAPVCDWSARSPERLADAEICSRVREAVELLPEPYRMVLWLRDLEGFDTGETAAILGLSHAAVKTRLHRSRQALRELLTPILAE